MKPLDLWACLPSVLCSSWCSCCSCGSSLKTVALFWCGDGCHCRFCFRRGRFRCPQDIVVIVIFAVLTFVSAFVVIAIIVVVVVVVVVVASRRVICGAIHDNVYLWWQRLPLVAYAIVADLVSCSLDGRSFLCLTSLHHCE